MTKELKSTTEDPANNIKEFLINHYGQPREWTTDHIKHLNWFINLAIALEVKNRNTSAKKSHEIDRTELDAIEFEINLLEQSLGALVGEVKESNITNQSKAAIIEQLYKRHIELKENQLKLIDEYFNRKMLQLESLGNGEKTKPTRGRPSKDHEALLYWVDYLTSELGSKNKAYKYIADHPMVVNLKSVSIRRLREKANRP